MAHHTSNTGRLQTLQSLERDSNWGQSLRVKGKAGGKGRAPLEVVSNQERSPVISTPKLHSVNLLTQAPSSTTSLGDKSEMAKAKRVEDALAFWMNQKSFRLSPVKQLCDTINENVETFPAEMRKALASGVVHTVRSNAATNRRRQLQSIFSEENIQIQQNSPNFPAENTATSSISFSASEQ